MASLAAAIKPLSASMRWLLLIASFLVFLAGFQLFILTEHTDLYFAWTIQPPLTAAFLGAGYFASFLLEFLAPRQAEWCRARVAVPAVFVFTVLTLIATVLNSGRFHFNSPEPFAQAAAWFWLTIYATVPPAMLIVWARQLRIPGRDSPNTAVLGSRVRIILALQGTILLTVGIGLFLVLGPATSSWPWKLTTLTSQAVGAWLIGAGILALHMARENGKGRVRPGLVSYVGFAVLQFAALVRYPSSVDWATANVWLYVMLVASLLLVGLYSLF